MPKTYTLAKIAELLAVELKGNAAEVITGVAPFGIATKGQIAFLRDPALVKLLINSQASAIILKPEHATACPVNVLISQNPQLSFAKLAGLFAYQPKVVPGIHPTAVIGQHCHIDSTASIGAHCVIGDNVTVGAHTVVEAGSFIGEHAQMGTHCYLHANVSLYHQVQLGNRIIIHSGTIIGADGFGMVRGPEGWHKIPQIGSVIIHDDVEVGANTTIDRGALENTVIHQGVKLDNLIQIAHNVQIGDHTVIAACAAIGGSVQIGKNCLFGGNVAIADHVKIVDQVILAGRANVGSDITAPGPYASGTPAYPMRFWAKLVARLGQLDELFRRVKKLENMTHEGD